MKSLLVRWAILSAAIWLSARVLEGVIVDGGLTTYLVIALVFGLINATLGSLAKLLTFPFTILTFGLWNLVVNATMLLITDNLNPQKARLLLALALTVTRDPAEIERIFLTY